MQLRCAGWGRWRSLVDDREAVVAGVLQHVDDSGDPLDAPEADDAGFGGCKLPHRQIPHPWLRAGFQERQPLQLEYDFVNAGVEGVAHGLGDEQHEHGDGQQEEVVGELEEDDAEGDGHSHGAGHERRGAEHGVEALVDVDEGPERERQQAAVRGAHQDDGEEQPRGDGDAEGDEAQHAVEREEDKEGDAAELVGRGGGEDVAHRVVVGGIEEAGEVVVVAIGAIELLEVAASLGSGADGLRRGVAGRAWCQEREAVKADRGEERDSKTEQQLRHSSSPAASQ